MSLTPDASEPNSPPVERIVDAHHHLWDLKLNVYPWLQGPPQDPSDPSGLGMLQQDYLVGDFLGDTAGLPLRFSVHVEAASDPSDPVRETRWLQLVADRAGFPHAIVSHVSLERADAEEVLASHLESPNVRGVRQMLDRNPDTGGSEETTLIEDPAWRKGLSLLAPLGLSFDLQILPSQLAQAARMAADFDETIFVLNHSGYHVARSDESDGIWRQGLQKLSRCPNVVVKVSGFDEVDPSWNQSAYQWHLAALLETFGIDRLLFASNFPVDSRTISYSKLVNVNSLALQHLSSSERDAFFYRNAIAVYRINEFPTESPHTSKV